MAVYDETGKLTYIGNVGTGFTEVMLNDLLAKLRPLQRNTGLAAGAAAPRARQFAGDGAGRGEGVVGDRSRSAASLIRHGAATTR